MPIGFRQPAYQYHDNCERRVYVTWLNKSLHTKELAKYYTPINPNGEDIFDLINDGVLYCETIFEIFPNSIDMTIIKRGPDVSKQEKLKNLYLAYETARSYGCRVNCLRIDDVFSGVRQSVLELFWQIFNTGLVNTISYENNPELILLKEPYESEDDLLAMKPHYILQRYVNYRISKFHPYGQSLKVINEQLNDGIVYAFLIDSLAEDRNITLPHQLTDVLRTTNESERTEMVIENFTDLKSEGFLHIDLLKNFCTINAACKMHLLTLSSIFHRFPLLAPTGTLSSVSEYDRVEPSFVPESNFEKLCKCFMNFQGTKPIITNIPFDCQDSLVLIQIMEKFVPGIFKKDNIIVDFKNEQIESKKIHNACIVLNRFQQFYSVPVEELYPEYMASGKKKVLCGLIYNLMLYWVINGDKDEDEEIEKFDKKELLLWLNSLDEDFSIYSFRDIQIDQNHLLARTLDKVFPDVIDWEYYNNLETRIQRNLYCLSVARREGLPMFVTPEMLSIGDHHSVMLAFAIIRYRSQNNDINGRCDEFDNMSVTDPVNQSEKDQIRISINKSDKEPVNKSDKILTYNSLNKSTKNQA